MPNQLIKFSGGVITSDSNNVPSTVVERDNQGNVNAQGVNADSFLSTLGALFLQSGAALTANATLDLTRTVVKCDATAAAFTVTLPPVAASTDQVYLVIKTDAGANVPTVKGSGTESIVATGGTANTYTGLTAKGMALLLWCDGAVWYAMKLT